MNPTDAGGLRPTLGAQPVDVKVGIGGWELFDWHLGPEPKGGQTRAVRQPEEDREEDER
jgi:hypothetical protein